MKPTTGQQKSLEISTLYVETLHIEKILFVLSVPMLYKDIHMKIIMGHALSKIFGGGIIVFTPDKCKNMEIWSCFKNMSTL